MIGSIIRTKCGTKSLRDDMRVGEREWEMDDIWLASDLADKILSLVNTA
jgi:hypothetical protein